MKARYEAIAKEGGARAVKKAILKKQKKVSQNEKRSRPFKKHKGSEIVEWYESYIYFFNSPFPSYPRKRFYANWDISLETRISKILSINRY